MSVSFIEQYPQNKRSTVAIRPYADPSVDNMGLQRYGLALFDNTFHEESIACLEQHGVRRFLTGLNEFAPEIKLMEPEEREAKIKQIRAVVVQLEKELMANVLDPADPEFWNKVKWLKPDNDELWDKVKLRLSNDPVFLDPQKDPYDLIKLFAIEAGGFSLVAKSLEDARSMAKPPRFYLDKMEDTAATKTEVKKLRNKALGELEKIFNKNQNKLFYICKVLDINSAQYRKSTPNDIMYDNMDKFIHGELTERDKRKTAERFLAAIALDMESLKIRAMVKDATYYKMFNTKSDGFIYDIETSNPLGRTVADVEAFLKNPLNEDLLINLTKKLEGYWNQ